MQEDPTVSAVRRLFTEVFAKGDEHVSNEILADDFTFQYPFPGFPSGRQGMLAFSRVFRNAFQGFQLEILDLFRGTDHPTVAIRWSARGTHTGDFLGIPPSGNKISFTAIGMYNPTWPPFPGGIIVIGPSSQEPDRKHKSKISDEYDFETTGQGVQLGNGYLEMDGLGLLQQLGVLSPTWQLLPGLRNLE